MVTPSLGRTRCPAGLCGGRYGDKPVPALLGDPLPGLLCLVEGSPAQLLGTEGEHLVHGAEYSCWWFLLCPLTV